MSMKGLGFDRSSEEIPVSLANPIIELKVLPHTFISIVSLKIDKYTSQDCQVRCKRSDTSGVTVGSLSSLMRRALMMENLHQCELHSRSLGMFFFPTSLLSSWWGRQQDQQ